MAYPLPRWIAHRGGGGLAPENTLAGLRLAARLGFRAVEVDVMLTADGVPVLLHDESAMGAVRAEDVSGRWLVNLGDAVPEDYARFGGVVEIVGDAPAERAAARLRWRRYAADGHDIQQHDLKALREGRT